MFPNWQVQSADYQAACTAPVLYNQATQLCSDVCLWLQYVFKDLRTGRTGSEYTRAKLQRTVGRGDCDRVLDPKFTNFSGSWAADGILLRPAAAAVVPAFSMALVVMLTDADSAGFSVSVPSFIHFNLLSKLDNSSYTMLKI